MKKSWGLTEKVLSGVKTAESRWYKSKRIPWDRIKPGDTVYFKDSGEPVSVAAKVSKVLQFEGLTAERAQGILAQYGEKDLGAKEIMPQIQQYVNGKKYAIFVFLRNPEKIEPPFDIDKTGFGAMAAWITVADVNQIKKIN